MKSLSEEQMKFLKEEFGIEKIDYTDKAELREIREKCFDIEVEDTCEHIDEELLSERGYTAVKIVNDLYDILHSV